jgi:hypothetical protein
LTTSGLQPASRFRQLSSLTDPAAATENLPTSERHLIVVGVVVFMSTALACTRF